jgi:hypothetical protein
MDLAKTSHVYSFFIFLEEREAQQTGEAAEAKALHWGAMPKPQDSD